MPDREKVIKDLEFCVNGHYKVELSLATKILTLLKEQEAVEPKRIGQGWLCGACDALLSIGNEKMVKFCSMCGKPIKW